MQDEKPLLSIICSSYNHEKFIANAIEGFLLQKTNFPIEIIIHDDASTDGTASIIRKYEQEFPQLIFAIYQTENQYSKKSGSALRKFIYPKVRGKYFAICEGDDYWTDPNKLQKQVDFLEANLDYVLCFTNCRVINDQFEVVAERRINNYKKNEFSHVDVPFLAPNLTRVYRNKHYSEMPNSKYRIMGGDVYVLVWMSRFGKIKFIDEVTATYRLHSGGVWSPLNPIEKNHQNFLNYIACLEVIEPYMFPKFFKIFFKKLRQYDIKHEALFKNVLNISFNEFRKHKHCFSRSEKIITALTFVAFFIPKLVYLFQLRRSIIKMLNYNK